jgi:predicted nuclease of predicted toxin-antitoxin system
MSQPRFLLDEHVWGGLVEAAKRLGVDAVLVQTQLTEGTDDEEVLALAASQGRILLTSNAQDFAPKAVEWFLAGREHWGIVIVPGQTNESQLSRAIENIAQNYSAESFRNTYRFLSEFA